MDGVLPSLSHRGIKGAFTDQAKFTDLLQTGNCFLIINGVQTFRRGLTGLSVMHACMHAGCVFGKLIYRFSDFFLSFFFPPFLT